MSRRLGISGVARPLAAAVLFAITACGGSSSSPSPTAPSPAPTPAPAPQPPRVDPATLTPTTSYTIGFSALRDRVPFATHEESGLTVTAVSGDWISLTSYGNPQPFIEFNGRAGATVTGEVRLTANGSPFWLTSIDFYSSVTKIPFVLEGFLNGETAFTVVDVIGNTFGAFAKQPNPHADVPIQELRIRLSNPAGGNPMGIDNIVIRR